MSKLFSGLLILAVIFGLGSCKPTRTFNGKEISVIPQPQKMIIGESSFKFGQNTEFVVENNEQQKIAFYIPMASGRDGKA